MKRSIVKVEHLADNRALATITLDCGHKLKLTSKRRTPLGKVWCWKCARPQGDRSPAR